MKADNSFVKVFTSEDLLRREQYGNVFLKSFFEDIPLILRIKIDGKIFEIHFQRTNLSGAELVANCLYEDKPVNLIPCFKKLANIHKKNMNSRQSAGGTEIFYLNRRERLSPKLENLYQEFLKRHEQYRVGGLKVSLNPLLIDKLHKDVSAFVYGYCVPSQGDFHERNIFTNGFLVDFEGAGWNMLAGDIATFLWHSLFVGNYFGPKYARWSLPADKKWLDETPSQLGLINNTFILKLSAVRRTMVQDYLVSYLSEFELDEYSQTQISNAIAFRLLTVFPVGEMDSTDQKITFILANFFANDDISLRAKLTVLDQSLKVL